MSNSAFLPQNDDVLGRDKDRFDVAMQRSESSDDDFSYFRPLGLESRLSVSFAPDGTSIFSHESNLNETFGHMLSADQLESRILDAFREWTRHGNVDVGVVHDNGDAFGVPGRSIGDDRFGDVRIGAFPMSSDVYAIALSQGEFVSERGRATFSSTVTRNLKMQITFFSVALHEVGHSLGLDHSDNPASVMHRDSRLGQLSRFDVAEFQNIYGVRSLDPNEFEERNDSFAEATEIKFDDDFANRGFLPSVIFGDVINQQDFDFFEFEIPSDYTGDISFRIVSEGISVLAPNFSVFDEFGNALTSRSSSSNSGDTLVITLDASQLTEKGFVSVSGNGAEQFGSYALVSTLDQRLGIDEDLINDVVHGSEFVFLDQEDVAGYLFDPDGYLFSEDNHTDDDHESAGTLFTEEGYSPFSRFHHNASLLDQTDIDVYNISVPDFEPNETNVILNVSLRSVNVGGMIPRVSLFDDTGTEVSSNLLVNGLGEYIIQTDQITSETSYFVHVAADDFLPFNTGNYELTVSYTDELVVFEELVAGRLGVGFVANGSQKDYHTLHIAESQMFQFAFEADELARNQDALLWVSIYDELGGLVYQAATRDGERRTANATYFSPGSYTIEVESAAQRLSQYRSVLNYRLFGINVGGPQGPTFNDPTDSPFDKNDDGEYVYPDDVITEASFVFVVWLGIKSVRSTR